MIFFEGVVFAAFLGVKTSGWAQKFFPTAQTYCKSIFSKLFFAGMPHYEKNLQICKNPAKTQKTTIKSNT